MKWIKCSDSLPELSDRSVLAYFSDNNCIDMIHVDDYFKYITSGVDNNGAQKYTKWYLTQNVTHWMELPVPPNQEPKIVNSKDLHPSLFEEIE
jgi:hypothetical protein